MEDDYKGEAYDLAAPAATAGGPSPPTSLELLSYSGLCDKFNRLLAYARHHPKLPPQLLREKQRRLIFTRQMHEARKRGESLYPVLRLLIPQQDFDRKRYGLQEAKLVPLLLSMLGVDKTSTDGQKIVNFKGTLSADGRGSRDAAGRALGSVGDPVARHG